MNKVIDQSELSRIIAGQTGTDHRIVEAFIREMFKDIETALAAGSIVEIEGLGAFRIINSGSSKRILFLGKSGRVGAESKTILTEGIDVNKKVSNKIKEQAGVEKSLRYAETNQKNYYDEEILNTEKTDAKSEFGTIQQEKYGNEKMQSEKEPDILIRNSDLYGNHSGYDSFFRSGGRVLSKIKHFFARIRGNRVKINKTVLIAVLLVLAVVSGLVCLAYYMNIDSSDKQSREKYELTTSKKGSFREIDNNDNQHLSHVIVLNSDMSLKYLAEIFYGKELFWPYIYKANRNIVNKSLMIQANSIVKIPKITVDLVGYTRGDMDADAKNLGNEIMRELGISAE